MGDMDGKIFTRRALQHKHPHQLLALAAAAAREEQEGRPGRLLQPAEGVEEAEEAGTAAAE